MILRGTYCIFLLQKCPRITSHTLTWKLKMKNKFIMRYASPQLKRSHLKSLKLHNLVFISPMSIMPMTNQLIGEMISLEIIARPNQWIWAFQ